MPSSAVHHFDDAGDFAASIRASSVNAIVATAQFSATITRVDLHDLWIQRYSDIPGLVHANATSDRAIIGFRSQPGSDMSWNGSPIESGDILRYGKQFDAALRSFGSATWGNVSLPVETMVVVGAALAGCDLAPPGNDLILTPPVSAMARLQRLHAAAGALAEDAPTVIAHDEAARGLEQALIQSVVACLDTHPRAEDVSVQRRHAKIMRRFHAAIEDRAEEAIYIPDICAIVGVPQRTLNACCHESLGMSPKRYLLLRRMNLARRALRTADSGKGTVTEIACRFGFWSFGRFAVEYAALFGESPSATLRSPRP